MRTSFPMRHLGLPLSVTRPKRIHFQHLEDKIAGKLAPWQGKHAALAGRIVLVKAVLATIAIYHLTPLDIPVEVKRKIDSILHAYLWAGIDKLSGRKCKINWDLVCKPKQYGALGLLNLDKYSNDLRLRWLWLEWVDTSKHWIGLGTPCTDDDRDLCVAATHGTVGNGHIARFWSSSWLQDIRPRDIAPNIFVLSRNKNCWVKQALVTNCWISNTDINNSSTLEHIQQFADLWEKLCTVNLVQGVNDTIVWKFTNDGKYSASSASLLRI